MAQPDEEYFSVSEAADDLGITRQRVLQLIDAGRLEARRVGNSYIILKSALDSVRGRRPGRPPKAYEATKRTKAKQK
jgi:excisionase family DNA binding protein